MTDHKSYIKVRDSIQLLVSMVEMTYGLPYKHEDHTTAIMSIDAQLEKINSQASFAKEQDRLEMIRILLAALVESGNRKKLDLELLFNQVGEIFKPDEEATEEDGLLHAAVQQHYQPEFTRRIMRTEEHLHKTTGTPYQERIVIQDPQILDHRTLRN